MLEWTGERYLPDLDPTLGVEIHYEHLHRYAFVGQFVKGKKVLDLACGEGYGSFMLAQDASHVTGVDIDKKTIKHARIKYTKGNLNFVEGSILDVPIKGNGLFDVIVCFEALEHVKGHIKLMSEVKRLLTHDGIFFVSTPNKELYTHQPNYHNPFHQKELEFKEFEKLLKTKFKNNRFFGQKVVVSSNVWQLSTKAPPHASEFVIKKGDQEFYFTDSKKRSPLYFIAVASNSELDDRFNIESHLVDDSNVLLEAYQTQTEELSKVVEGKAVIISDLENKLIDTSTQLKGSIQQINELGKFITLKEAEILDHKNILKQKDVVITEFDVGTKKKDTYISRLEVEVRGQGVQIGELEGDIHSKEVQIGELEGDIHSKEVQIGELNGLLSERDKSLAHLEGVVEENKKLITHLKGEIRSNKSSLTKLEKKTRSLEKNNIEIKQTISAKDSQLQESAIGVEKKNEHISNLEDTIRNKDSKLNEQNEVLVQINKQVDGIQQEHARTRQELHSINSSIVWRSVKKWQSLVDKTLPHGTRRRKGYDLSHKGVRIIADNGLGSFWWSYKQYLSSRKATDMKDNTSTISKIHVHGKKQIKPINQKISVIIPSKNAGLDFEFALTKIRNQKGIKEVEIIVIDSGSKDQTIPNAKKYGAKVFKIKSNEFNHGLTRNYGAQKASGEFLIFLVQDAIPIGDYWLYDIVNTFKRDSKIAALTVHQVPRSDANLFACYSMWNHYRTMEFDEDKIASLSKKEFQKLNAVDKRKYAGIDDVCSCFRKDVFDKFKFKKIDFAEDLELGIRLIEKGYKIGFLYSVGVIHSHNRSPDYSLRRSYVDSKLLADLFENDPFFKNQDVDEGLNSMISLFDCLKAAITKLKLNEKSDIAIGPSINSLKAELSNPLTKSLRVKGDETLEGYLLEFRKIRVKKKFNRDVLLNSYYDFLDNFGYYSSQVTHRYDGQEYVRLLYHLFSLCCGCYLGNLYPHKAKNQTMKRINKILTKGV
ncbi:methyltransferase domain-containing protein [Candidatus Altiarchaeota archaeon]